MRELERSVLARHTPCRMETKQDIARALAVVHGELLLIHPFREGNGRLARLLAMLMGLQAGLAPLNFSTLDGRGRQRYIAGIHAAMDRNYAILEELFERITDWTWKSASSRSRRTPAR